MASMIDFRFLDAGLGGPVVKNLVKRKRAREEEEDAMEDMETEEHHTAKRAAVASSEDCNRPSYGKPTYDGTIAGLVSGRKWKAVKTTRASAMKATGRKITLVERVRQKELKKAFQARKNELKEEIRTNKQAKRKAAADLKKRKEENVRRSAIVQKITNPNTIKKMMKSKKQRKLLRKASFD